ncbi:MAG: hypothetical protein OHK005_14370 [Candidatus Methylacidiphilales bacterium]
MIHLGKLTSAAISLALMILGHLGLGAKSVYGQELAKSDEPFEVSVPLVGAPSEGEAFRVGTLKLGWPGKSGSPGVEALRFEFVPGSVEAPTLRADLWIAALSSALAWRQTWQGVTWKVSDLPPFDTAGNSAALGVGMIAAASGTTYPDKTVVLGGLNPDGSLGLVSGLNKRLEAAAQAGMRRVVIPKVQSTDYSSGRGVNIPNQANRLGIECVPVETLYEAVEIVLGRKMPDLPRLADPPALGAATLSVAKERAQQEKARVDADRRTWPKEGALPRTASVVERALWAKVFAAYQAGEAAMAAGQPAVAFERFRQVNGLTRGLNGILAARRDFKFPAAEIEANGLRQVMVRRLVRPSIDKNELQSALVLAEEADWLYAQNARLEGSLIVARQAFSPRSEATAQQQQVAQELLAANLARAAYELRDGTFLTTIYFAMDNRRPVPVYDRASLWLRQLIPAQLALSEFLNLGLRARANDLRETLIFDPRLASYARLLRDAKRSWEQQEAMRERERRRRELAENPEATPASYQAIGFVPGPAYGPPRAPEAPAAPRSLSDAAAALAWVNDYCEVAMLEQQYLRLGGTFDPARLEWRIQNKEALGAMLATGDISARRGIMAAGEVGADPTILTMIYQNASSLRREENPSIQMEALRQYWRCALLGNMVWQLGSGPPPAPESESETEPEGQVPQSAPVLVEGEVPPPPEAMESPDDAPRAIAISPDIEVLATPEEAAALAPPQADVPRALPVQPPLDTTPIEEEETVIEMTTADPSVPDTIPVRRALPVTAEEFAAPMVVPEDDAAGDVPRAEPTVPEGHREEQVPAAIPVN